MGELDCVNTLIYTIIKHFIGTPSNITARISDSLQKTRHLLTWELFTFFATSPFPNVSKVQTLVNVFFFFFFFFFLV
jgi:hypothetical protein